MGRFVSYCFHIIFSYIWPSANYGHQLGGPFAWSKSSTPAGVKNGEKSKSERKSSKSKVDVEVEKKHHTKKGWLRLNNLLCNISFILKVTWINGNNYTQGDTV